MFITYGQAVGACVFGLSLLGTRFIPVHSTTLPGSFVGGAIAALTAVIVARLLWKSPNKPVDRPVVAAGIFHFYTLYLLYIPHHTLHALAFTVGGAGIAAVTAWVIKTLRNQAQTARN